MIRIYTDGSCTHNGQKGARAGIAVVYPDMLDQSWGEPLHEGSQTNQTAELTAIYMGLRRALTLRGSPGDIVVHVHSDSEYSINCLTKWYPGWKRRDWKTAEGKPVVHRDIIERILDVLKQYGGYVFVHVKAHTSGTDEHSKWNRVADELARNAVDAGEIVRYTTDVKVIRNTEPSEFVLPGIPLAIMGAPISELDLVRFIRENLDSLEFTALKSGLLSALKKTLQGKKYELEKNKIGGKQHYRLIEQTHLTVTKLETTTDESATLATGDD